MSDKPKLIVLRGPSGSGKSTIANLIREQSARNIAVVGQDYFPEVMFHRKDKEASVAVRRELLIENTLVTLRTVLM